MKTIYLLPVAFLCIFLSCSNSKVDKFDNETLTINKFIIPKLQTIVDFQNQRNSKALIEFFNNSDVLLRETAVMAMASVQDLNSLNALFDVLENDESVKVRLAAAFAIGQIGNNIAEKKLIGILNNEDSNAVKAGILEGLGKCGSDSSLNFLIQYIDNQSDEKIINACLLGLARFANRSIFSEQSIIKILSILVDNQYNEETRYFASIDIVRLKDFDLNPYISDLSKGFENTSDLYTKMNIVAAFSKTNSTEAILFLQDIANSTCDYRIKVNAIKSLSNFEYSLVNEIIFSALSDSSNNLAIQASEYFLNKGISKDSDKYLKFAKYVKNWRVRANLYASALRISEDKSKVSNIIILALKTTNDIYEKANLLRALSGDVSMFQFVNREINSSGNYIIKSSGMDALAEMRRNPDFGSINDKRKSIGKSDLSVEFAGIFKTAILSGDVALVAIAAEVIRDPALDFRNLYKNSYFLSQALNNCKLPQEIETYRELQKTIAFFNGSKEPEIVPIKPTMPDWEFISQIPYNQKIEINTSKGKIIVELSVNQTPVSVSNFLKLINQKYFDNNFIHRTVPNFVVQDGCPRGDGWGGPDYVICSEFALNYFTEGSFGMASAGKDTESSQWFITNSPTPHLDGKYTNFGKVIKGMETVHVLEVGDTIKSMQILKD